MTPYVIGIGLIVLIVVAVYFVAEGVSPAAVLRELKARSRGDRDQRPN